MATNLITGWEADTLKDLNGSGRVQTAKLNINTQQFNKIVPHIVSPVYGRTREFSEYYHGKLVY